MNRAADILSELSTRWPWFPPLILALLAILVYANSFPGAFILDDHHIVANNPLVANPDLPTIFRVDYWYGVENSGLFRPLTILSLAINRMLLGPAPWGFHLVNVLLHAGAVVLLWQVLNRWGCSRIAAILGAALFAVHPIHTEVVNIVVGRNELLVAVFLLAAFLLADHDGWRWWLGACVCYLLAQLSKEHAMTFLALLPLRDAFAAGSWRVWLRRWPLYLSLIVVALGCVLWSRYALLNPFEPFKLSEAVAPQAYVDTVTRVLTALLWQGSYLAKLLLPVGLQSVYSPNDLPTFIPSLWSAKGLLVVTSWLAVATLLVWGWRKRFVAVQFAVLYLVAFSATTNIFVTIGVAMAERLAYFPSAWFCAGGAVLLTAVVERRRTLGYTLAGGYLLLLAGTCLWRNPDFKDELALWQAEVLENPRDYMGWHSLGGTLGNLARIGEAEEAFRRMTELAPDYAGGLRAQTFFYLRGQLFAKALPSAEKALALSLKKGDTLMADFDRLDVAEACIGIGDPERAESILRAITSPLRGHARYQEVYGKLLSAQQRDEEALAMLGDIPVDPPGHFIRYTRALSLYRLGRLVEAREQIEAAIREENGTYETWNLLGVLQAQGGDWSGAVRAFEKAVELKPDDRHYLENLARARRESGR